MDVGIVGGSGYAAGELLRLLDGHPDLHLSAVAGRTSVGTPLAEVFPQAPRAGTVVAAEPEAMHGCDLVFLATPHGASLELAPALLEAGHAVVDLSGAFRLPKDAFEAAYGESHTAPDLLPAPFGLPELFPADLDGARLVANPGCYPTAALLALGPVAALVEPASVAVAGLSGWSGAGKGLREDLHASHAAGNVGAYAAPEHRHGPEIAHHAGRLAGHDLPVTFVPHLVPMARGLVATLTARTAAGAAEVADAYEAVLGDAALVHLLAPGAWPQSAHVRGAATARLGWDVTDGRLIASCAIDNLGKGAAAQAIQNANLILGLPETAGLPTAAVYP